MYVRVRLLRRWRKLRDHPSRFLITGNSMQQKVAKWPVLFYRAFSSSHREESSKYCTDLSYMGRM